MHRVALVHPEKVPLVQHLDLNIFELVRADDAVKQTFNLVPAPGAVPDGFRSSGGRPSCSSVVVAIVERFQFIGSSSAIDLEALFPYGRRPGVVGGGVVQIKRRHSCRNQTAADRFLAAVRALEVLNHLPFGLFGRVVLLLLLVNGH